MAAKSDNNGTSSNGRSLDRRRRNKAAVTPQEAMLRYLSMGQQRSINKLVAELDAADLHVNRVTVEHWSKRDGWVAQAREFDAMYEARLRDELASTAVERDLRQARMGYMMQRVALRGLSELDTAEELHLEPGEIARFADTGMRLERLAQGAANSNVTVIYNQFMGPVLQLFQTVVATLPDNVRGQVTKQFADGVNGIRDAVFAEEDDEPTG